MRGSPLIRALVVFVVLLALGRPLRVLTGGVVGEKAVQSGVEETVQVAAKNAKRVVGVEVTLSRMAKWIEVKSLGKVILRKEGVGGMIREELDMEFSEGGMDWVIIGEFEGEDVSAIRVGVQFGTGEREEQTVWGGARVEKAVTFLGGEPVR